MLQPFSHRPLRPLGLAQRTHQQEAFSGACFWTQPSSLSSSKEDPWAEFQGFWTPASSKCVAVWQMPHRPVPESPTTTPDSMLGSHRWKLRARPPTVGCERHLLAHSFLQGRQRGANRATIRPWIKNTRRDHESLSRTKGLNLHGGGPLRQSSTPHLQE